MEERIKFYKRNLQYRIKMNLKVFKIYTYTSILGAIIMFLTLFILTSAFRIYYILSFIIAFIISLTVNFILNRVYTFRKFNPKKLSRQYFEFFLVSISAFLANLISLYILVELFHIFYLLSQLIISLIGLPMLYLVNKKLVFSHK